VWLIIRGDALDAVVASNKKNPSSVSRTLPELSFPVSSADLFVWSSGDIEHGKKENNQICGINKTAFHVDGL
jgi:hypothetical protein